MGGQFPKVFYLSVVIFIRSTFFEVMSNITPFKASEV